MSRHVARITTIMVMLFYCNLFAYGAVITTDCSQSSIQSAIDNANDYDTISVNPGNCIWTNPVTITNRAITIKGAGIDQTIITDSTSTAFKQEPFWITTQDGKFIRITGFTFTGLSSNPSDARGTIFNIQGTGTLWRIDQCKFADLPEIAIQILAPGGVIDNNIFNYTGPSATQTSIMLFGPNTTTSHTAWSIPPKWGIDNARALYVEHNTFNYSEKRDSAIQASSGSNYVFRYNTVYNTVVDMHGPDSAARGSAYQSEVYNNTFICTVASCCCLLSVRGGTTIVFNNTVTGPYSSNCMQAENYRSCFNNAECPTPNPSWGICDIYNCSAGCPVNYYNRCDGTSKADGNTPGQQGWPCFEQPGTSSKGSDPIYAWNNTLNGKPLYFTSVSPFSGCSNPSATTHVKLGRDYFNAMSGIISSRPTNCAPPDSYYATDTNQLFNCISTNTWKLKKTYAPLRYPQPLADTSVPKLGFK